MAKVDLRQHQQLTLAILSDTHGYLDPAVAAMVKESDIALHAGDIMGAQVLDQLQPRLGQIIAVRGNNDLPALWHRTEAQRLRDIPASVEIHCQGGVIAMEHGHLLSTIDVDHFPLTYRYPDARLVVYGHTHRLRLDDDQTPWLLNPGAAGTERTGGGPSCCQLHIDGSRWRVEMFRFEAARRAG